MLSRFGTKKNKGDTIAVDTEPVNPIFREHVLSNISINLTTLSKNDWIAPQTFEVLVNTLQLHGLNVNPNTVTTSIENAARNSAIVNHDSYASGHSSYTTPSPSTPARSPTFAASQSHISSQRASTLASLSTGRSFSSTAPPLPSRAPEPSSAPPPYIAPKVAHRASGKPTVIAISDFEAVEPEDLPFRNGDIITVIEDVDENWYKGELRGRSGIFPKSYVQSR